MEIKFHLQARRKWSAQKEKKYTAFINDKPKKKSFLNTM